MAAAPAAAAVWADVLWCLGLGCLLWAVRDGAELLVGRGPVRCFVLDLLAFTAAAVLLVGFSAGVSAAGLARWYMAAGLAGRGTGLAESHRAAAACLGRMDRPIAAGPGSLGAAVHCRTAAQSCLRRLAALKKRCCPRRPRKKAGKSKKSGKNQLQKKSKILYN